MSDLPTPADLPPGLSVKRVLSRSERATTLQVIDAEGAPRVLRIGLGPRSVAVEAALSSRVRARGLVPACAWGTTPGGSPYLLRPYVEGQPLDRALAAGGPADACRWVRSLLETLAVLHEAGFVHRDLKAGNVLVGPEGVFLVDLELAAHAARATPAGSPFHVAPELLLGQPGGPAADLFSLGALLAIAFCGPPAPDFHASFPAESFWAASGLEPRRLPPELSGLVRSCVQRLVARRPASARAAARMIELADAQLPPLDPRLPFLAGRESFSSRAAARLRAPGQVLRVALTDPEEAGPLADDLQLELATEGRATRRIDLGEHWDPGELEQGAVCDAVVACARGQVDERTVARLLQAFAALDPALGTSLILVAPAGLEPAGAPPAGSPDPAREEELLRWPRVPVGALEQHLLGLSDHASPGVASRLAATLHALTGGRWRELNRRLTSAVPDGVFEPSGPFYDLLLDCWPASGAPDEPAAAPALGRLTEQARAVLQAVGLLEDLADLESVASVAALSADEVAAGVGELLRREWLERRGHGGLAATDEGLATAALEQLDEVGRAALRRRVVELLQRNGADRYRIARHQLELPRPERPLAALVEVAEEQRRAGRLGRARALAEALARELPRAEGPLRERVAILRAQLELAQGSTARALAILHEHAGSGLRGASGELLCLAAEASETQGDRAAARAIYSRLLRREPRERSGDSALRARIGLAYGRFLDGDPGGALDEIESCAEAPAADENAAALLNLRAAALANLDRLEEAREALEGAWRRAEAAGDPALRARVLLHRAYLERRCGEHVRALESLEQAMQLFTSVGHVRMRALAANNLGVLQRDLGDLAAAARHFDHSLALRRRVGDAHGMASTVGNLALVALDAGCIGRALERLGRARELLEEGGYTTELGLVELQTVMADSLRGRVEGLERSWARPAVARARERQPLMAARIRALWELATRGADEAAATARSTCEQAARGRDPGEEYRAAALWAALSPGAEPAQEALHRAAGRLGSALRRVEADWRTRAHGSPADARQLQSWLDDFEQAQRWDLVRCVALELAELLDREGDPEARRALNARARHASEALTEGLSDEEAGVLLARLDRLAGRPALQRAEFLAVDWFLTCNRRMAVEEDLEELLKAIVDMALQVTGARRGFIVLADGESQEVRVARGRGMVPGPSDPEEARFSSTVVRRAIRSGEPVLTTDAARDERFAGSASIVSLSLKSVLCVPLSLKDEAGGALYVDNEDAAGVFDAADVERLRCLADQASIAITNLRRHEQVEQLNKRLSRKLELQEDELGRARRMLRRQGAVPPVGGLIGESGAMRALVHLIQRLAPTDLPILISGPSGAGKNLVASALHGHSRRASGPLVVENVATLPSALVESELFGHVRGAFTGADRARQGLFEEADGGTFFLDEIGDLPLDLQVKFLRVLETGECRPVGSSRTIRVDVRIIAATNKDLGALVQQGRFRPDLYYRLNAAEVRVPPLSDRIADIPLLVEHFLGQLNAKHGTAKAIALEVVSALSGRSWPGEIRELANEVARLYYLSDDRIEDPQLVRPAGGQQFEQLQPNSLRLDELERSAIRRALELAGRKDVAARLLGISRGGLYTKMKRLGL